MATPALEHRFEGADTLNPIPADIAHRREPDDGGTGKSVVGGWHSREDVMAWPEPDPLAARPDRRGRQNVQPVDDLQGGGARVWNDCCLGQHPALRRLSLNSQSPRVPLAGRLLH
jgi:hypothetical protein